MKATYITHSGDDLLVVNAARVSFSKTSEWERIEYPECTCAAHDEYECCCGAWGEPPYGVLSEGDTRLIRYLARHKHWTPFGHPQITLHIKAPVFVRTQCFKHKVGFVENEVSRRYVHDTPTFWGPEEWRKRAENKKQGSSEEVVDLDLFYDDGTPISDKDLKITNIYTLNDDIQGYYEYAQNLYQSLLKAGVCPEQARSVLPQSMYTEWYWTGSLAAYARFCNLRLDPHAQKEIQDLAEMVSNIIHPLFPVSWPELIKC